MKLLSKLIYLYWLIGKNQKCYLSKYFLKILNLIGNLFFRFICYCFPIKQKLTDNDSKIIVSLTSIPSRIGLVWCVLESIFRQTILPDKLILYLSLKQFKDPSKIIQDLEKYTNLGLEIVFVEEDLGPHKKYFYAFSSFPNSKIITIDDDLIYHSSFIESMVSLEYNNYSVVGNIYCDYSFLDDSCCKKNDYSIPIGAGGVLYNVNELNLAMLLNQEAIINTSLFQDDLWLYFNNQFNNVSYAKTNEIFIFPLRPIFNFKEKSNLTKINVYQNGNQKAYSQIKQYLEILIK
jgi:hypothetical protein